MEMVHAGICHYMSHDRVAFTLGLVAIGTICTVQSTSSKHTCEGAHVHVSLSTTQNASKLILHRAKLPVTPALAQRQGRARLDCVASSPEQLILQELSQPPARDADPRDECSGGNEE